MQGRGVHQLCDTARAPAVDASLRGWGWRTFPRIARCKILPGYGQDTSCKTRVACWLPLPRKHSCSRCSPARLPAGSVFLPPGLRSWRGQALPSDTPRAQGPAPLNPFGTGILDVDRPLTRVGWASASVAGFKQCRVLGPASTGGSAGLGVLVLWAGRAVSY